MSIIAIEIIVVIVSILITILIAGLLLDTTGKVNQGNYRVSDIVIESSATVTEVQDTSVKIEKLTAKRDMWFLKLAINYAVYYN